MQMTDSLFFDGYPLIKTKIFANPKAKFRIFLNCPHGYFGPEFLQNFPKVQELFSHVPEKIFQKYLNLEMDFGSSQLAFALAEELSSDTDIILCFPQVDRGLLDANRTPDHAVRKVFDHQEHGHIRNKLKKMSTEMFDHISKISKEFLKEEGLFLDLHTMWPTCQRISPEEFESPDSLEKYVEHLLHPENQKQLRAINFLVSDLEKNIIADSFYVEKMAETFQLRGIKIALDTPYQMLPKYTSYHYYKNFSGVSIDIPRSFLGHPLDHNDPWEWEWEEKKGKKFAKTLAEAVRNAVWNKEKKI